STRGDRLEMLAGLYLYFWATSSTAYSTLSLHDALPILAPASSPSSTAPRWTPVSPPPAWSTMRPSCSRRPAWRRPGGRRTTTTRSEEHTSELQSRENLVCRLLLEKKKTIK